MNAYPEELDIVIVGAGISGIGAAYHIQHKLPSKSYLILESRKDLGGTWDLFRYPGVRSDSDLFTFGYDFRPWDSDQGIADGPSIKRYIADTAREFRIDEHIHFEHRVLAADWDSNSARWRLLVRNNASSEQIALRCRWLFCATGYYDFEQGYSPEIKGREDFRGRLIHPQQWPEDLDYSGKRIIIIGSGATAVTLLPALAEKANHVIMLQRTPGYIMPLPARDGLFRLLKRVVGDRLAFRITRERYILQQRLFYLYCRRFPNSARNLIRKINRKLLPPDYPVDKHFNPPYNPWDQRLCAVPDGDFFQAIARGKASVVTDTIREIDTRGLQLDSGEHLEADIIVLATGLKILPVGGIVFRIDGKAVHAPNHVAYKGFMLSGVPNLGFAVGYTTSSWTLKVGLLCEHFCRLLKYMDQAGYDICTPVAEENMVTRPLLDFGAGYVQRAMAQLPRRGLAFPWLMSWDYKADVKLLRKGPVPDKRLRFEKLGERAGQSVAAPNSASIGQK